MDFVLPSITAILLALAIIIYVFPRLAPVILAFFAAVALAYGLYNHYLMFGGDYMGMTFVDKMRSNAPQIMVGIVVVFLIAYLLFVFGLGKSPSIPSVPETQPSPNTATNALTKSFGMGLNAAGFNNSRKNTFGNASRNYNLRTKGV
jgi:predicted PurR-regulated permease PerM